MKTIIPIIIALFLSINMFAYNSSSSINNSNIDSSNKKKVNTQYLVSVLSNELCELNYQITVFEDLISTYTEFMNETENYEFYQNEINKLEDNINKCCTAMCYFNNIIKVVNDNIKTTGSEYIFVEKSDLIKKSSLINFS